MSKIVEEHGGTIDKFMGDAIMVLFGDNDSKEQKPIADAALPWRLPCANA